MAFYGNTVDHWRAYGNYSTSQSNTAVSVSLSGGFESISWGFDLGYVDCTVTIDGTSAKTTNNSFYSASGATVQKQMASTSKSIARGTSARSITLKVVTYNHSGWRDGTSTATTTITIPALSSYTVSYNANGGEGAPANQTKYYGQDLTLSTTIPTRSGYSFKGWATSSTSTTVAYNSGGKYTGNAALALYAVWSLDYIEPTIGSVEAIRCDSSGQEQVDGTYAKVSITWSTDSNYAGSKCDISYKESSASSYGTAISVTLSGNSGTIEQIINGNFNVKKSYSIKAVLTDTHSGTDTAYGGIPVCFKFLQLLNGGTGLAIGKYVSEPNKIETTLPIKIQFSTITDNVTPSEDIYDRNGMQFLDSNNTLLGWMGYASRTNGIQGNRVYTWRDNYFNGFNLNIKSDGTPELGFESNDCKRAWLDALEPDILFEQSSLHEGMEEITLSTSAANYNHMRIYYKYPETLMPEGSVEIFEPNGKYVNLFIGYAGYGSGYYWPCGRDVLINGNQIQQRYSFLTTSSNATVRTTGTKTYTLNNTSYYYRLSILRVEAWNDDWWG